MSTINTQIAKESFGLPKIAIGVLLAILLFGMFIVGYDQGQLFSIVEGQIAYDEMWMHEFYHDMRHAAGFPCHQALIVVNTTDMKTLSFILITLIAGAISGTVFGLINLLMVEPFIDQAIELEVQNTIASGEPVDRNELEQYRLWQKGGEVVAGTTYGISISALFGIVYAYARGSLPGSDNKRKGLVLAAIMFFVIYLIPAFKYPANPPAVGDPETILYREGLYIGMLVISGFSALGVALLYRRLGQLGKESKKIIVPVIYAVIIAAAYAVLPPNPDEVTISNELLINFRVVTAITMGIFWGMLGILLGWFWNIVKPHETTLPKLGTS